MSGYTNTLRSGQEKKNDIEIDSAYQSAKNVVPDTKKKNLIRGAMSGQSQQRPKTNDSECRLHAVSRRRGLSKTETRLTGVSVGIGLKGAAVLPCDQQRMVKCRRTCRKPRGTTVEASLFCEPMPARRFPPSVEEQAACYVGLVKNAPWPITVQ